MDNYEKALERSIVEETIIGDILTNDNLINEMYLQPRHFLNNNNRILISKILDIKKRNGKVDLVLLCEELENDTYLQTLAMSYCENLVSVSNFHEYQEKQEEIYKGYMINEVMNDYNNKKIDYEELMSKITNINNECTNNDSSSKTMLSPKEIFELITTNQNELTFRNFGKLQSRIRLMDHTVNVIAARTSQGKSAFALNLMNDLSQTYKCLYFNMEMTEKEIYQRLTAINCGVPINDFYDIENNNKGDLLWNGIEKLKSRKIKIFQGSKNVRALRTILMKESKQEHCIAFIDYIGYVFSDKYNQNDRERIGDVVRQIQSMTKDLNITVFMIAQINRDGVEEPSLTNLKDSGELEQTAHCVMLLHNPNKDINEQRPEMKLLIPKNRSGQLGQMRIIFDKPTQKFIEI